jgi:hypothetical protein
MKLEISEQIRKCEQRFNNDEEVKSVALRINGTGLLLGCMVDIDHRDDLVKNWAAKWLDEMDVTHVTVVLWSPPIESGSISLFEFYRKESSSLSSSE